MVQNTQRFKRIQRETFFKKRHEIRRVSASGDSCCVSLFVNPSMSVIGLAFFILKVNFNDIFTFLIQATLKV